MIGSQQQRQNALVRGSRAAVASDTGTDTAAACRCRRRPRWRLGIHPKRHLASRRRRRRRSRRFRLRLHRELWHSAELGVGDDDRGGGRVAQPDVDDAAGGTVIERVRVDLEQPSEEQGRPHEHGMREPPSTCRGVSQGRSIMDEEAEQATPTLETRRRCAETGRERRRRHLDCELHVSLFGRAKRHLLAGDRRQLEEVFDAQPGYCGLGMAERKAYNWWIGDSCHAQRTKERAPGARVLNVCIRRQHELGDKRSAKECFIITLERGHRRLRRPVRVAIVTHRAGQ